VNEPWGERGSHKQGLWGKGKNEEIERETLIQILPRNASRAKEDHKKKGNQIPTSTSVRKKERSIWEQYSRALS